MEKKNKLRKEIDEKKHLEKLKILQDAKTSKEKQLAVDLDTHSIEEIDRLKEILNKKFDDPEEKYQLYYNGIRKVLMQFLPKGKSFEKERRIIYDEKNIFLNRGKAKDIDGIRRSDGRMTFNDDMNVMADLISDWVMTSQDPVDLYQRLFDLNEEYGYPHQEYDGSSASVHNSMKKTSS